MKSKGNMRLEKIVRNLREAGFEKEERRRFVKSYMGERFMERLATERDYGVGTGVVISFGYLAAFRFMDNAFENVYLLISPLTIPAVLLYMATRSKYERKFERIKNIVENNRINKKSGYKNLLDSKEKIEGLDSIFH